MNKLFQCLVITAFLCLASCHKEAGDRTPDCTQDGIFEIELFNGFAYPVSVTGTHQSGGGNFGYQINPGKRITLNVTGGKWDIKAHWTDGNAPYAHNSGDFDKINFLIEDCPKAEINYPF